MTKPEIDLDEARARKAYENIAAKNKSTLKVWVDWSQLNKEWRDNAIEAARLGADNWLPEYPNGYYYVYSQRIDKYSIVQRFNGYWYCINEAGSIDTGLLLSRGWEIRSEVNMSDAGWSGE